MDILNSFIGSSGIVLSVESVSYDDIIFWVNERKLWVDVFNVTSPVIMEKLWELGASVAPKSLSQVGINAI